MHKRLGKMKLSAVFIFALLLSAVPFAGSFADDHSIMTAEEKLAELEANLLGLRGLVKSLTVDIQKVADSSNIDMGEFQPRLFTIEKVSKENAFEVKLLKGSVGELAEAVSSLEELRPMIYQSNTTMKEMKAYFNENAELFLNRIAVNEGQIDAMNEELRKTLIIIGVLDEQIAPVTVRIDALSNRVLAQGAEVDAIEAGLQQVADNQHQATATLNGHIGQLDRQVAELEAAIEQASKVSEFAAELDVHISELIVRSTESEQTTLELTEFLSEFEKFDREARDMRNQIEQFGGQIMMLAEQAEENSHALANNAARLDRLQQMRETSEETESGSRLEEKINEAFLQFSTTQNALDALEQSISAAREDIKREVLRELPRIPTTDEIVFQIEETAAAQIQEANARADQAQNVAMIALVTGIGAIAVSLLLP